MRALVFDGALRLDSAHPDPRPGPDEALIRVRRAGICGTDLEIVAGYKGFQGVLGHEFVGEVVEAPDAPLIRRRVSGEINIPCRHCDLCRAGLTNHCRRRRVLGILGHPGAFADYLTLPVTNLHLVPDAIDDEAAVFVEPLAAAAEIETQVDLRPGMEAVVVGDGRLGILCAQVLAAAGVHVTVSGRHPNKLAVLAGLGIAATTGEFPAASVELVVEASGSPRGMEDAMRLVRPRGTIVLKSTMAKASPIDLSPLVVNEVRVVGSRCGPFERALALLAAGTVRVHPLIDRTFSLDQGIEAMARAAVPGVLKVVLLMQEDPPSC